MQVIWALAPQHPLAGVTHEVTLLYVGQIQDSSLSCFAVGDTSSSMVPSKAILKFCEKNLHDLLPVYGCETCIVASWLYQVDLTRSSLDDQREGLGGLVT